MLYRAIAIYYLAQLCSLVVVALCKEIGEGRIGRFYQISFEG